jgi:hypothetical protein
LIYLLWAFLALVGLCCCCGLFYLCLFYGRLDRSREDHHVFLPDNHHPSYVDSKSAWRRKRAASVSALPFGGDYDDDDDDDGEYKQQRPRRRRAVSFDVDGGRSPLRRGRSSREYDEEEEDDEPPPRFSRSVDHHRRSLLARSQLDNHPPLPPMPGYSMDNGGPYPPRARDDDDDSTTVFGRRPRFDSSYSPRDDDVYYDSSRRRGPPPPPPVYHPHHHHDEGEDHRSSSAAPGRQGDILTESRLPHGGRDDHDDGDILAGSPTIRTNRHVNNTGRSELWAGLIGS